MKITPEVLDAMPNPKFLVLTPNLQVDIPSFFKIYNPYKIAHYATFGIPELIEAFMTAEQFEKCRPIPEVFNLVKQGSKRFERYLDNTDIKLKLFHLIDVTELPKLQMDPWAYLPNHFDCTMATKNRLLQNLKIMQTWDAARIKTYVEEVHVNNKDVALALEMGGGCEKGKCLFADLT